MAKTTRANKAGSRASEAFAAARSNPYVQRLAEDAELRQNLRDAYEAARSAYGRVARNGKKPAKAIGSKKVQKDLRSAADSLRTASEQLRAAPKRKRGGIGKLLLVGAVGAGVTLALSENARKAVMDRLFGAEEEFEYTSTTSDSTGSTDGSGT